MSTPSKLIESIPLVYTSSVHKETIVGKEKTMTFVQARSKLSEIVDRVAEHGDAYVVSKRQKPIAVIIGIDRYRELSGHQSI